MTFWEIAAYLLALGLALVLCRIFIKPLKGLFILVLNSLLGGVGLYIFNLIFGTMGFTIGLNVVTAAVVGTFGLPGLVLLIILKLVFNI